MDTSVAQPRPSVLRYPRRRSYPVWGALLALGAPVGFLALRIAILAPHSAPTSWVAHEIAANTSAYAYLTIATLSVFLVLGAVLGRREDKLESTSATDPLTGLWNRRHLQRRLTEEVARASRLQTPLALLFVDVDRLKALNDLGGHEAGDAALELVGEVLAGSCRASDVAARYGGDEFVVLAPETTAANAVDLAERIRATFRKRAPAITVSIGIADLEHARLVDPARVLEAADRAMYSAKALGRDRVVMARLPLQRMDPRRLATP